MPRVVLVGPMGAGKSTVAALLGRAWGLPTRDTDDDVEMVAGKTVSDIFVDDGEERFRDLEAAAVARALVEHDGVLSLGGGAVLREQTRDLLRDQMVVFLNVGLSDAVKRVGMGIGRPLLLGNVRSRMKVMLDERLPVHESLARVRIAPDGRTAAEVADAIRERVETLEQEQGQGTGRWATGQ